MSNESDLLWSRASLARRGPTSDVTVITGDGLCCMACSIEELPDDFYALQISDFLDHLAEHQALGHKVPAGMLDLLRTIMRRDSKLGKTTPTAQ